MTSTPHRINTGGNLSEINITLDKIPQLEVFHVDNAWTPMIDPTHQCNYFKLIYLAHTGQYKMKIDKAWTGHALKWTDGNHLEYWGGVNGSGSANTEYVIHDWSGQPTELNAMAFMMTGTKTDDGWACLITANARTTQFQAEIRIPAADFQVALANIHPVAGAVTSMATATLLRWV
jgi:hypothetical protein